MKKISYYSLMKNILYLENSMVLVISGFCTEGVTGCRNMGSDYLHIKIPGGKIKVPFWIFKTASLLDIRGYQPHKEGIYHE